jgi:glucosylceramidase
MGVNYLNFGVPNYCYWNMILNETGKSGWGWKQNSLININRENQTVTYNPDYAVMTLFSKFIRPGFKRIAAVNWKEEIIAMTDNSKVYVFLKNETDKNKSYDIRIKNEQANIVDIPPQSLSVVVMDYF